MKRMERLPVWDFQLGGDRGDRGDPPARVQVFKNFWSDEAVRSKSVRCPTRWIPLDSGRPLTAASGPSPETGLALSGGLLGAHQTLNPGGGRTMSLGQMSCNEAPTYLRGQNLHAIACSMAGRAGFREREHPALCKAVPSAKSRGAAK
jgi:hypothetical protein